MANFFLKDFYIKNTVSKIVAVSWQVSVSERFDIINNETIFDTEHILRWDVTITRYGSDVPLDVDDVPLYARVKVYTMDMGVTHESDWYVAKLIDPTNGEKDITFDGNVISRIKDNKDGTYTTLY